MSHRRTVASRPVGFTLIEMMITVGIVSILAAIAIPSYNDYVRRGKIIEGTTRLSNFRVRMEQTFMDTRTYPAAAACTALIAATDPNAASRPFDLACGANTATTYRIDAVGKAAQGMGGFEYRINEANVRTTFAVPGGWGNNGCGWVTKKSGDC